MKQILSQNELDKLAQEIRAAELKTSGELRLMLVERSSSAPHAFMMLSLILNVLGLMLLWLFRYSVILHEHAFAIVGAVIVSSWALGWLLARIPRVQRLCTFDGPEQVMTRAELEFHREGLGGTAGATGILIFLSLFEHQAVVLGDKAIAQKLKPETWRDVVNKVLEGGRTGRWAEKLHEAIAMCGAILQQHFPIKPGDKNELPNHVIVKK